MLTCKNSLLTFVFLLPPFLQHAFSQHVRLLSAELTSDPSESTVSALVVTETRSEAKGMVEKFNGIVADDSVLKVYIVDVVYSSSPSAGMSISKLGGRLGIAPESTTVAGRRLATDKQREAEAMRKRPTLMNGRNMLSQAMRATKERDQEEEMKGPTDLLAGGMSIR